MVSFIKKWSGMLAFFVLAGCVSVVPTPREKVTATRGVKTCHERMALSGRFSVRYLKDGKEESVHGSFRWGQDNHNMRIVLMSPLGDTQAMIDATADSATLTSAGKVTRTAEDVDALVQESLGWPMPVSGLRDWIQACMRDERGYRTPVMPENRELATSDGWRVTYPVWTDDGRDGRRPKRIDLQRSERGRREVSVRLIIDEWMPYP